MTDHQLITEHQQLGERTLWLVQSLMDNPLLIHMTPRQLQIITEMHNIVLTGNIHGYHTELPFTDPETT